MTAPAMTGGSGPMAARAGGRAARMARRTRLARPGPLHRDHRRRDPDQQQRGRRRRRTRSAGQVHWDVSAGLDQDARDPHPPVVSRVRSSNGRLRYRRAAVATVALTKPGGISMRRSILAALARRHCVRRARRADAEGAAARPAQQTPTHLRRRFDRRQAWRRICVDDARWPSGASANRSFCAA